MLAELSAVTCPLHAAGPSLCGNNGPVVLDWQPHGKAQRQQFLDVTKDGLVKVAREP